MKIILVDAWNTFIKNKKIDSNIYNILEDFKNKKIILFDGICNLCSGMVQFTIKRDPHSKFKFASLQSERGQAFLKKFDLPLDDFNSFVSEFASSFSSKRIWSIHSSAFAKLTNPTPALTGIINF